MFYSRCWFPTKSSLRLSPFGADTCCHQSRDHWTRDIWFPIGDSLKLSPYLAWLLRYVSHLAKHIPIENALIPILRFRGKIGGNSILQLLACSRSRITSFELLTATIGPRASLLRCSDLPIENSLRGWKNGAKWGRVRLILTPNEHTRLTRIMLC